VIAYNDSVGIGALAALLTAGVHVPRDMSVIGFDDIQAVHAYPRLTTVSHLLSKWQARRGTGVHRWMSSKPITDMSRGTCTPAVNSAAKRTDTHRNRCRRSRR